MPFDNNYSEALLRHAPAAQTSFTIKELTRLMVLGTSRYLPQVSALYAYENT